MAPATSSTAELRPTVSELAKGISLATGRRYKVIVPKLEVETLVMEDVHFHDGSAVVLPWRWDERPDATERQARLSALSVIAAALRHAKDNPAQKLLLVVHADGPLSWARGQTTQALLKGDRGAWGALCAKHQTVQDLQLTLAWVAETHGWPCHPGAVDGTVGPRTRAARDAFRQRYNRERSGALPLDAKETLADDWNAFFDLFDLGLTDVLGDDLCAGRAALTFHKPEILISGRDDDGRVDLLFLNPAKPYPDFFSESPPASSIYGAVPLVRRRPLPVEPPVQLVVKLTAIHGLYKPGFHTEGDADPKASGYQQGYTSDDDLGRIFVNHKPRTNPRQSWQHAVVKDTQYIELLASVELAQGSAIPPAAQVEWDWFDPNSPDHPETQDHGARLPDQVDVDGRPRSLLNRGTCDFPKPGGQDMARFAQARAVGFADGATVNLADTQIKHGTSRVRLHVSNVAGDSFVVIARPKNVPRIAPPTSARTGAMTVWKRIDVEYVRMKNAFPLPVDRVPQFFEPARVQMDFAPERVVPSKRFLTAHDDDGQNASTAFASAESGEFKNQGKPGWFFLGAVERLSSQNADSAAPSVPLYQGAAKLEVETLDGKRWETLVVDQVIEQPDGAVEIRDVEGGPRGYALIGKTTTAGGKTHFYLSGLEYHSDFEVTRGEDTGLLGGTDRGGAYDRADVYFPRHHVRSSSGAWEPGGLGFQEKVFIRVNPAGNVELGGLSPGVWRAGREYFAGRTLVFTRIHGRTSLNTEQAVGVIVHELTHAFGFPHQCGFYAWPDPPTYSCAMNYFTTWLYAAGTRHLQRFELGIWGGHLCPKHLAGVREVHLEDNPAMWTWT